MKQFFFIAIMSSVLSVQAQIKYPQTRKEAVTDNYHGTVVEDPYRWLEDDNSAATKNWVNEQNIITQDYLDKIPFRRDIYKRLQTLWNYPKYGAPFKKGDYYYFFKNDGLQNQAVMYRQVGLAGMPEEFLNPNSINQEGIVALGGVYFTKTGKYMAYAVSVAGSDWQEIYIMETASGKVLSDKIEWSKFSGVSWNGDDGFYYSAYNKPDSAARLSGKNEFHKVFYHKLGTAQTEDQLIYEDVKNPLRYHSVGMSDDKRFLFLTISEGTSGNEIWFRDLKQPAQKSFKLLIQGFTTEPDVIDNYGDKVLVRTNDGAPNYKVVLIDPNNPLKKSWKTIIPETKEALQNVTTAGKYLFLSYLKDAASKVYQYTYEGKLVREIVLPGIGSADGFSAEKEDTELFYTYSSFATPPTIYRYNITSGVSTLLRRTDVKLDENQFTTEQIFITSKDGTKVPVFLSYKKGLVKDGSNPVLLYGYGGFNVPITPGFNVSNAFFMEQGGIYAVVNLRGGSEYGEAWHKAGMLEKKQNVFDDFIAATEELIKLQYTSQGKIAIRGGSNGGLLVGAVMTQRPDLFTVALPAVGVLDMLRYHKFTIGWGWVVEYGSADTAKHFPFLHKYSPYHNLKKGTTYPATLITTADHDDRVVPAHSFKFAARLQEYHIGNNPVLIRIETNAGHGAGKPTDKQIAEAADTWSFVMHNLGMNFKTEQDSRAGNAIERELQKIRDKNGGTLSKEEEEKYRSKLSEKAGDPKQAKQGRIPNNPEGGSNSGNNNERSKDVKKIPPVKKD